MITRRRILSVAAVALATTCGRAYAQPYPHRPIKMVVPFAPGGADVIARLVADRLATSLGQPVIIENRPGGAGGTVGTKTVAVADPDGYTLTLASPGPITVAPAVFKNLDYDPVKNFAAVAMVASSPFALVINSQLPARSVQELVAYAKSHPGQVNYGTPGFGTSSHLFGELLKLRTGAPIVHVPYRGSAPAIVDLLAGQVQLFFDNLRNVQTHIQSGKLRALAVTSETRSREMPDVPTMLEAGIDDFIGSYWNGVLAPAGTPSDIVARLGTILGDGLRSSEMQASLLKLGMEPKFLSPQEFGAFIAAETKWWAGIAKAANI